MAEKPRRNPNTNRRNDSAGKRGPSVPPGKHIPDVPLARKRPVIPARQKPGPAQDGNAAAEGTSSDSARTTPQFPCICPGEKYPISRAVCLARQERRFDRCMGCQYMVRDRHGSGKRF